MNSEWIMCPICGNKTRDKIREDPKAILHPPERTTFMEVQAEPDMIGNYSEM